MSGACAGKPSLSALGFGGKIFLPSLLLLWWLSGQPGSGITGTYLVADSGFNCLALVRGCLNSVDLKCRLRWSHQQNSLAVPPSRCCCCSRQLSRCTGKSLLPLAPREVCNGSSKLEDYFPYALGEGSTNQSTEMSPHFNDPSGGSCVSRFLLAWIHHVEPTQFLAAVAILATTPGPRHR